MKYFNYIKKEIIMKKILDLWCWEWNNKHNIYNNIKYETYWVDIEQENIDICVKKYPNSNFRKIDWEILPFDDNFFNIIHSLDVLEHVDDLNQVLKETTRVLKSWWKFIIEVPYWKSEERLLKIKPEYWQQVHHVRMFKDWEMEKVLNKFWFELVKIKRIKFFDNVILWYLLKNWNIINQKWNFSIKPPFLLSLLSYFFIKEAALYWTKSKIIIYPFYLLLTPIRLILDNIFPKSIYFEFIKK